jgi:hypothetical protein
MRTRVTVRATLALVVCVTAACAPTLTQSRPQTARDSKVPIMQLWSDPADLPQRNLLWGAGQRDHAPSTRVMYKVVERDLTGYSPGYDVVGPDGRKWSIKVGKEAQTEVVLSRILWALGYFQPETYYVKMAVGRRLEVRRRAGSLPAAIRSQDRR